MEVTGNTLQSFRYWRMLE